MINWKRWLVVGALALCVTGLSGFWVYQGFSVPGQPVGCCGTIIMGSDGTNGRMLRTDVTGNLATVVIPSGTAANAITPIVSTSVEAGHVLKASPGNLYSIYATTTATGLLMVFNSATVPADGAVTPLECVPVVLNGTIGVASINYAPGPPSAYSTGISVAFSTGTNCFSKTGSATAFFHGTVQ